VHRLGLVSISFRKHAPREILQAMREVGLTEIEWGSDVHAPPEKAAEIARLQAEFGINCSSYGTYFTLGKTPLSELERYIAAAQTLGTEILRLWCGEKNSEEYGAEEKAALFAECRKAAEIARKNGVTVCMECHNYTYTNRKESALELMQAVGSPQFGMYWQPNQYRSERENLAAAKLLAPYTERLHVFHWRGDERLPLADAVGLWQSYLANFPDEKTLLLEFMPDDRLASLATEARALREIAGVN